jgi:hypothetical protein
MPDPNLQAAMKEIADVIQKHNCIGVVALSSESHVQHLFAFEAPWTCMRLEDREGRPMLRFKALAKDFPSQAAQKKCVEDSVGALLGIQNTLEIQLGNIETVLDGLPKGWEMTNIMRDEGNVGPL